MANNNFNYDTSYNQQMQKELERFKMLRTVFIVLGAILVVAGIIGIVFTFMGFFKESAEIASTSHSMWDPQADEKITNFFSKSLLFILFGILMSGGMALIGVGSSIFTIKIKNRERVLNEGKLDNNYTIDDFDKRF